MTLNLMDFFLFSARIGHFREGREDEVTTVAPK